MDQFLPAFVSLLLLFFYIFAFIIHILTSTYIILQAKFLEKHFDIAEFYGIFLYFYYDIFGIYLNFLMKISVVYFRLF